MVVVHPPIYHPLLQGGGAPNSQEGGGVSATEGKTSHAVTAEADRAGRGAHPPCVCLSVRVSPLTVLEPGGRGPFNSSPPPPQPPGGARRRPRGRLTLAGSRPRARNG